MDTNEDTGLDMFSLTENEVHVGPPGKPFLILRADGRVQFGTRVKPDSAASRFLGVLEAHWPRILKRLEKTYMAQQFDACTSANKEPTVDTGVPGVDAGIEHEKIVETDSHVSLDEQPTTDGVQVEETAGEEVTLGEEPVETVAELEPSEADKAYAEATADLPEGTETQEDAQHESDKDAAEGLV